MRLRHKGLCVVPVIFGCWSLRPGDDRPDASRRDAADVTDAVVRDLPPSPDAPDVPPPSDVPDVSPPDAPDVPIALDARDVSMDIADVVDVLDVLDGGDVSRDVPDARVDAPEGSADVPGDAPRDVGDVGDVPIVAPASLRLVYPPGLSTVTTTLPTLRWNEDVSGMEVVICEDRGCSSGTPFVAPVSGRSFAVPRAAALRPGVHFWHLRRRDSTLPYTATWQFRMPMVVRGNTVRAYGVSCRDTNLDGFNDVAVGAPGQPGTMVPGAVLVHRGSDRGLEEGVPLQATGASNLGADLAWGDFNGDDRADLAVVAFDATAAPAGSLWYFQANANGFLSATRLDCGMACSPGAGFARRVTAGDVNGDGLDDIFLSGSGANAGVLGWSGRGFGPTTLPMFVLRVTGGLQADFGASVAVVGDLDGDGFGDLVVGAPCDSVAGCAGAARGRLFVYYGGPSWAASGPSPVLLDGPPDGRLGLSLAAAGDVNDDGYADFVAGGTDGATEVVNGVVRLYLGGPRMGPMTSLSLAFTGLTPTGQSNLGRSVAAVDLDDNGLVDIVAGATGPSVAAIGSRGAVVVWLQFAGMRFATPGVVLMPTGDGGQIGSRVAAVGDVNGDGRGDLLGTAPATVSSVPSAGRFFVWHSTASAILPREPDATFSGMSNQWLGRGLAP